MTPESKLKAAVIQRLKQYKREGAPIRWLKIAGSPMQQRGMPDLWIVFNGQTLLVELKAPGEVATPLQQHEMEKWQAAGARCHVCTTLLEFEDFIDW